MTGVSKPAARVQLTDVRLVSWWDLESHHQHGVSVNCMPFSRAKTGRAGPTFRFPGFLELGPKDEGARDRLYVVVLCSRFSQKPVVM
jgi:hypothetical protein